MRCFFMILSAGYVSAIFVLADSPVVYSLSAYNPSSLLHIPLYTGLSILLVLSVFPSGRWSFSSIRSLGFIKTDLINIKKRLLICTLIAAVVAVADEIHQTFIPKRNGSATDVTLDFLGIILVIFVIWGKLSARRS